MVCLHVLIMFSFIILDEILSVSSTEPDATQTTSSATTSRRTTTTTPSTPHTTTPYDWSLVTDELSLNSWTVSINH